MNYCFPFVICIVEPLEYLLSFNNVNFVNVFVRTVIKKPNKENYVSNDNIIKHRFSENVF